MGQHAEDIINGLICERCYCLADPEECDSPGYPRLCNDCENEQ